MDKNRAVKLLDKVFNAPYSHENFEEFIVHLLNMKSENIKRLNQNSRIDLDSSFKDFIESVDFFGRYVDNNGKKADILSVKLARDNSKVRARVKQRNFIANWLKRSGSNCALIAFYDNSDDWRFSFVELEYKTIRMGKDNIRDIEELSPAKRLSFLVGRNEPNHTCKKYLLDFIIEDSVACSLDSIREAFSIENVSKEFFDEYRGLYEELLKSLEKIISSDELIKTEFKSKDIKAEEFSKKLLGQIVFIYFLQKKGWLGVPRNGKWGGGRKDFLRAVYEKEFGSYNNFFNEALEPLFYNALAVSERDNDYYEKFGCRIPFLNGGLFEPIGGYDWVKTDISIDNAIFGKILDTFDEFNFTINEDEPLEKEVAVDPEMLGKIFENLLDDNLRKGYGAFYTPREIVHYMCQESLINYLDHNSKVERTVLDALVRQGNIIIDIADFRVPLIKHAKELDKLLLNIRVVDPAVGSGAFPVGMLSEIVNARLVLGELMKGEHPNPYQLKRDAIENSLYGVDIDASAVDIAKLRFWLSLIIDEDNEDHIDPLPNLEQKIMCGDSLLESFHGIKLFDESLIEKNEAVRTQIDEINSEIAVLYEKMGAADFGTDTSESQDEINTLKKERLKLEREQKASGDQATVLQGGNFGISEDKKRLRELKDLQNEFFNETVKSKKIKLRKQIDNLEWKFIEDSLRAEGHGETALEEVKLLQKKRSKPFFLWKLYFSDVFSEKGGFDIVIGNPPYVQIQGLPDGYKDDLSNECYDVFEKKSDLYCLFYERGYGLLRDGGILSLITSNKWMRAGYGKKLRNFFAIKTNPLTLIDFAGQKIFESATVDVNILIFSKNVNQKKTKGCIVKVKCSEKLSDYIDQKSFTCAFADENSWVILSPIEQQIKEKIEKVGTPLKDWDISIYRGVLTGCNEAFIIDGSKKDELIAEDPRSAEIIRPILRGRDIKRYKYNFADLWLIATFPSKCYDIEDFPGVKKYLLSIGKHRLEQTGKEYLVDRNIVNARKKTNNEWFETQDSIKYWEDFSKQKIIWGNLCLHSQYAIADEEIFINAPSSMIIPGNKYLLGVLNSKIADWYIRGLGVTRNGGYFEYKPMFVEKIPIPIISENEQIPFILLVDKIIEKMKRDESTEKLECELELLVADLYGINISEKNYLDIK